MQYYHHNAEVFHGFVLSFSLQQPDEPSKVGGYGFGVLWVGARRLWEAEEKVKDKRKEKVRKSKTVKIRKKTAWCDGIHDLVGKQDPQLLFKTRINAKKLYRLKVIHVRKIFKNCQQNCTKLFKFVLNKMHPIVVIRVREFQHHQHQQ